MSYKGVLGGAVVGGIAMFSAIPSANASSVDELKAFPALLKGYDRYVVHLPAKPNESDLKVEIVPTKQMEVDGCNTYSLQSRTSQRTVKGWGYRYHVVNGTGVVSTLMACPNKNPKTQPVAGPGTMVDYNSKLPVVVFAPKSLTVRYRIWSAAGMAEMEPSIASAGPTITAPAQPESKSGGKQSVTSTQAPGKTVVIRKRDKYGNTIKFKQSD